MNVYTLNRDYRKREDGLYERRLTFAPPRAAVTLVRDCRGVLLRVERPKKQPATNTVKL
jgi:hypothetical protein